MEPLSRKSLLLPIFLIPKLASITQDTDQKDHSLQEKRQAVIFFQQKSRYETKSRGLKRHLGRSVHLVFIFSV